MEKLLCVLLWSEMREYVYGLFFSGSWLIWSHFLLELVQNSVQVFFDICVKFLIAIACRKRNRSLLRYKWKWLTHSSSTALVERILSWSLGRVLVAKSVCLFHAALLKSWSVGCHIRSTRLFKSWSFSSFMEWAFEDLFEVLAVEDIFASKTCVRFHK